ncbi:MAG: hypothetical protein B6U69_02670 [Thermofilum sp. ex4484_15]|nr:MAG: hypothetical protein B6U69_02670 [Thermofilum sp. ex4484_15]
MTYVVITGGMGFIGRHTIIELVKSLPAGVEVAIVDKVERAKLPSVVTLIHKDIRDREGLKEAFRDLEEIDAILHLAAIVSIEEAYEKPSLTVETNVLGTLNLLELARMFDISKFVYASSVAVYGEPKELPIREDHPLNPLNLYGLTKLMGEQLAFRYLEDYGLKVISLRYFNVYGPGMKGGRYAGVIHKFITSLLKGRRPVIYGDGSQTRDFIYVDDVVRANLKALESKTTGPFNIGSGVETSVLELYRYLTEIIGVKGIRPKFAPPRRGDVKRSLADIRRAGNYLGWKPRVDLKNGLAKTVAWYRSSKPTV